MTALTKKRAVDSRPGVRLDHGVAANAKIWEGGMVCFNAAGFLVPADDVVNFSEVQGIAGQDVDNTGGANGAKTCPVVAGEAYEMVGVGLAVTDQGKKVYAIDDQTVQPGAPANAVVAGSLVKFISATAGFVFIPRGGAALVATS